jgi:aldehyde:ferredoxin oxidoreductase
MENFMDRGYMGKVLWVDLSSGKIEEETIPDSVYKKYLSGLGLGAYLLYNRMPANADPLGPENILGFLSGLLTGTGSLFTGRWMVVGKSPLTGGWGDANCGGTFSPAIKRCGYDGIFFKGISTKPVYLFVDKGKAEIKDASGFWGMDTVETEKTLIKQAPCKKPRVACIGPAGEKLSLISGISNDRGRMAARSGLGAVMGSKKLKAVVLGGAGRIKSYSPDKIKKLSKACNASVKDQSQFIKKIMSARIGTLMRVLPTQMARDGKMYIAMLDKWGTASMNQISIEIGDAPIKNWKGSNRDFGTEKSGSLNPDVFTDCVFVKYHCYSCPLGCGGICSIKGKYSKTHKPEYETVLALGGLCMNNDPDSIFYLNEVLNRAGLDTISVGGTVAFALECYEKGIITKKETGGLELTWGNSSAIVTLVEKIVKREGIGDLLADGSKVAAQKIGNSSMQYAIQAGGQELGMHDGRNDPGFALHNCVEPTPGRHTIGSQLYYEMFQLWKKIKGLPNVKFIYFKNSKYLPDREKIVAGAACSKYMNVINGAGCCMFGAFLGANRLPLFDWLNAATGWKKTPDQYMEIGERIQTLRQLFNVKHGIEPQNYKMSDRALGRPPLKEGANKGRSIDIEKMMGDYWEYFGWDTKTGKPTDECLKRLGI